MTGKTVLDEAGEAVFGARRDAYNDPAVNFANTAQIWSAILGVTVTAPQVGLCMIGLKLSREQFKHTRDNLVDIAGYAATLEIVAEGDTSPADVPASYPDIVDGEGDTWEFHHLYRDVPQYVMRAGDGVPQTAETILRLFPRHPGEIVDSHDFRWVHKGEGLYTMLYLSGAEAYEPWLVRQSPESIYERFGKAAADDVSGTILGTLGESRLRTPPDEDWSFEIVEHAPPKVGGVIPRDDIASYTWQDGAVLRTTRPNAPIHRAGGEWWFGTRGVFIRDFPEGAVFDVLAVGA